MKKSMILLFLIVGNACLLSVTHSKERKPWTVLIYVAESGSNSASVLYNLKKMTKTGSNNLVNVIVYMTLQEHKNGDTETKKIYVEKNNLRQIGPVLNRDSGDIASFAESLEWATLDYPSEHLAVIMVGRGVGIINKDPFPSRGLCYDVASENYLTDSDCNAALSWIYSYVRKERKIDILACEASFLSSVEMAHAFAPFVNYFIAPEGKVGEKGFAYDAIIMALTKKLLTPFECAQAITSSYSSAHGDNAGYALSLVDLHHFTEIIDNINVVAQVLDSHCNGKYKEETKEMIKKSVNKNACPSFNGGMYVDVCQFYRNLLKNIKDLKLSPVIAEQFEGVLQEGIALFADVVKEQITHRKYKTLGGLSIYFARRSIHPSYFGSYWIDNHPQWLYFLESFLRPSYSAM
jgi:hypothetical protein